MAAKAKAANDNTPEREPRRYAGRRGEQLARRLAEETGIW